MDSQSKIINLLDKAEELKHEFEALQPMKLEDEKRLWEKLRMEWNYNSNHIEGNTLTYTETELLLKHDKVSGDHTIRELEEVKAHDLAVAWIKNWAQSDRQLTESDIRELNKIILVKPFWKEAMTPDGQMTRREIKVGVYKQYPNSVLLESGEMFEYASPQETPIKMAELIEWLRASKDQNPIALAAEFHHRFILIHPFDDGNGRVARLMVNLLLMQAGYLPIVVKSAEKRKYLDALQKADAGDMLSFVGYIAEQVIWVMELGIKAGKGEVIEEQDDTFKKLELLRRRIKSVNPEQTIQKRFNNDTFLEIVDQWANSLFEIVIPQLGDLEDLFTNVDYHISIGDCYAHFKEKDQISFEKIRTCISERTHSNYNQVLISLSVAFNNFKALGTESFSINQGFKINFTETSYQIEMRLHKGIRQFDEVVLYKKLLHQPIITQEMAHIRDQIFKDAVDQIEREAHSRGL